eukprot:GAHX01000694.1.p1 GENE.GAHX01000694.1~~GAHX01000694.1.p1  ORF type:complete len:221 (+),score=22.89 GAHX01000694.1:323-985(+)
MLLLYQFFKKEICWHIHSIFIHNQETLDFNSQYFLTFSDLNEKSNTFKDTTTQDEGARNIVKKKGKFGTNNKAELFEKIDNIKRGVELISDDEELSSLYNSLCLIETEVECFLSRRVFRANEIKDKRRINIPQKRINKALLEKVYDNKKIELKDYTCSKRGRKSKHTSNVHCKICFCYNDKLGGDVLWIYCDRCDKLYHQSCVQDKYNISNLETFVCCMK